MAASTTTPNEPAGVKSDLPSVPWNRVESFVGQVTHDIRNGLNALELQLTYLGEISTDPEAVDEVKRLRGTLGSVTRQLQALRLATHASTPYPVEYPAAEFFDDLRERFAKLRPEARERIRWEIEPALTELLSVDPEQTFSALLELLSNALHFTAGETPPIRVQVSAADGHAVFRLLEPQAAAPAVPPEDWGRAPLSTTRRGAYGLGLFGARRGLESQGGTLTMEYSSENHLLTTTVTLRASSSNPS